MRDPALQRLLRTRFRPTNRITMLAASAESRFTVRMDDYARRTAVRDRGERAEAREFADVYVLAQRYGKELLLARAAAVDAGFDPAILASMLRTQC